MSFTKYVPIIVAVILAVAMVSYAVATVPSVAQSNTVTLRVGYPDSLDESDVSDTWAFTHILPNEGINVIPTYYDAPPLAYKGLISGQQDIVLVSTSSSMLGITEGEQTTCLTAYNVGSGFITISNSNITTAQQMLGKTVEAFGPGSSTYADQVYFFHILHGMKTVYSPSTPQSDAVNIKFSAGNVARVADLRSNVTQAISVDTFILPDFQGANNVSGQYHVLMPPTAIKAPSGCYLVMDSWLTAHYQLALKFVEGLMQSIRFFDSYPTPSHSDPNVLMANGQPFNAQAYEESQLPLTSPTEIAFAVQYYPLNLIYSPWGEYNFGHPYSMQDLFDATNQLQIATDAYTTPVSITATQYGVWNSTLEQTALQALGPYTLNCALYSQQALYNPSVGSFIQSILPSQYGGTENC